MGQSIAYSLWRHLEQATLIKATKTEGSGNLVIVERDPTVIKTFFSFFFFFEASRMSNSGKFLFGSVYFAFSAKIQMG